MIDLRDSFYNITFEWKSSYNYILVIYHGKFRWLRMPMDLTQAPAHFQYIVKDILKGQKGLDRTLPIIIYICYNAVFGDFWEQMLANTIHMIKRLTIMRFVLNPKKSQLVQTSAKILSHILILREYCALYMTKLEALSIMSVAQLRKINCASLYS